MSDARRENMPICPLQSVGQAAPVPCSGKLCAWWDRLNATCFVPCMAEGVNIIADVLGTLTEEKAPASDGDADGDEWGNAETPVSGSTIAENGGVIK